MFGINGEILVDVKVSRTEAKDVLSVPLSHHFYKSHRVKMFMQDLHRSLSCFEAIFTNFNWFKIMRKNVRITRNVQFIRVAPVLEVQITGNNCLLHDGLLPSTAYRRHINNCLFSTPRTHTLQKCKEPQLVCTFYLVTINDSYFPTPLWITSLHCSIAHSSSLVVHVTWWWRGWRPAAVVWHCIVTISPEMSALIHPAQGEHKVYKNTLKYSEFFKVYFCGWMHRLSSLWHLVL